MLTIKAFSSYSDLFVTPLFPGRGGDVELSILFSGRPNGVLLFADSSSGNTWSYRMDENGMTNGYQRYTGRCTVPDSDEPFRYYFAFFTQSVKGTYFNLGVTKEGDPVYSLHNEHFAPDEDAMLNGIIIQTASALKLLEE